jgi:hypothetical protein
MDTPNTLNYMLAGYLIFSVTFFGYLVSLWVRWQGLQAEEKALQEVENQE